MPAIDSVHSAIARGAVLDATDNARNLARKALGRLPGLRMVPDGDPRKPQRPDGDAGASWVVCRTCGRGAAHVREIRHRKYCPLRAK